MTVTLNAAQLRQALALLGGCEETKLSIKELQDGVFAWVTEYPEEGSIELTGAQVEAAPPDLQAMAAAAGFSLVPREQEVEQVAEIPAAPGFSQSYGDVTGIFADMSYRFVSPGVSYKVYD